MTAGNWYDNCCLQASSEVPECRMHRFVSMKQSGDSARARVPAPGQARLRNSGHSGRCELIAMASVAEVREHAPRRAESLGHWPLRWRASLARSRPRQRRSRAAHQARRHQHRTKGAEALRSTVDPGCGDLKTYVEAPPPLWRLKWHNRTRLDVSHAQVSEMLADSAISATFALRKSRRCALRRAESQPEADLGPNWTPHRSPRQRAPSSGITVCRRDSCDVSARLGDRWASAAFSNRRCFEAPIPSERIWESLTNSGIACRNARALALQRGEAQR